MSRYVGFLYFLIAFLFGLIVLPSSAFAASYYVSLQGSDANSGTSGQPWKTITKAANTMVAGDTVLIHAGTYYETVSPAQSGNSSQYITYRNYGDGDVVIDGGGGAREYGIRVSNKSYLQFIGLKLRNNGFSSLNAGFAALAGSHYIIIDGITTELSRFGILLMGNKTSSEDPSNTVSFITVKNSIVRNNAAYGVFIYFKTTDTTIGPNNLIYNENNTNGVPVDDQYGIDIDTDFPGDPLNGPRRITIVGNEIYGNRIQGIRPWNGWYILIKDNYVHHNAATGIQVEDGCQYVVVEGNRTEYNSQGYEWETGIWIDGTSHSLVQNNSIRGNQIGLMVSSSDDVLVRNNTIYENNRAYSGSNIMGTLIYSGASHVTYLHNTSWRNGVSGSRGNLAYCVSSATDTVLKNNIFSESAGSNDGWINCPITSDYNNFYNTQTLSVYYGGSNKTWTGYQTSSGQDTNSITSNPQFTNPTNGNFSLLSSSQDINSGDFLTKTRSSGSGNVVPVSDARYFSDGMNLTSGDTVMIGNSSATVTAVDTSANTLTINKNLSWNNGDGVSYPFSGSKPDIGAFEYGEGTIPTSTPVLTTTPPPISTPAGIPGDANGDEKVDEADYSVWRIYYNPSTTQPGGVSIGDFNTDSRVDGIDYVIWLINYNQPIIPTPTSPPPQTPTQTPSVSPSPGIAFSFASIADTHGEATNVSNTASQISTLNPKFVILSGDYEETGVTTANMDSMKSALGSLYGKTFIVRGKHDTSVADGLAWQNYFASQNRPLPAGVSNYVGINSNDSYLTYSFDYGNSRFIGVDIIDDIWDYLTSAQLSFIDSRLTDAETRGLKNAFLFWHGPEYCIESTHCPCSSVSDASCTPSSLVTIINKHPILKATFHGHEHILGWVHMSKNRVAGLTRDYEEFVTSPAGQWTYNQYIYPARVDYYYPNMGTSQAFAVINVPDDGSFSVSFYKVGVSSPVWSKTFSGSGIPTLTPTPTPSLTPTSTTTPPSGRVIKYYGVDTRNIHTDADYSLLASHDVKTVVIDTQIGSSSDYNNVSSMATKYNMNVVIWPNQGGDVSGCGWETPFNSPQNGDYIWRVKPMLDAIGGNPRIIGIVTAHEAPWNQGNCRVSIADMAAVKTQIKDYMYSKFGRTDFKVWNYIGNISDMSNIVDYSGGADIGKIMDVAVMWLHCFGGAEGTCEQAEQRILNNRAAIKNAGLEGKVEQVYLFQTFAMGGGYRMPTLAEMQQWDCHFINTGAIDGFMWYTWGACWYASDLYCPTSTHPYQNLWPEMNRVYNNCVVK